ncbi:ATP-dependent DNA helicase [Anaplasma marginale str. St. Maries]|uniref:ATP-dependent DNA helicase RecG n=1 Tax=Anaplasma marginale TaxID=770 RepID=UPI0000497DCE|nr:ATP-dependent DNA helicase RecG [Anaplasma marginale]AAV87121.1 ATP-dependent DNA helicase [Anaplasma marginale str. St. Maries]
MIKTPRPAIGLHSDDKATTQRAGIGIFSSIYDMPNMDNKKGEILERLCGGHRLIDILLYAPYGYVDRTNKSLAEDSVGRVVTFTALVKQHMPPPPGRRAHRAPYKILLESEVGPVSLIFFNHSRGRLSNTLKVGHQCVVSGKLETHRGALQIVHPDYVTSKLDQLQEICTLEPLYSVVKGFQSKAMHKLIKAFVPLLPDWQEWIRPDVLSQNSWCSWKKSVEGMHDPDSVREVYLYKGRLAYDELLSYHAAMYFAKQSRAAKGVSVKSCGVYRKLVERNLGFELTDGQKSAIEAITSDQASEKQMTMLLQGDVGSGKTVVALFAILNAVESGGQVALMVPTEILAEQHYARISDALSGLNICTELLTGSTKNKQLLKDRLLAGDICILIGTHALFQESVRFRNLRLVVIDEQQRFGVVQRMRLAEKGESTDVLFISATPIPRTLEQILYGNIDRVTLFGRPQGRRPVHTSMIQIGRIDEVCHRLQNAISEGHKAYWICPRIVHSETSEMTSAEGRFIALREIFGNLVGIAHGALPQVDKDKAIRAFHAGDIKILVATTVIEVGIDVPDATIIVIENPEKFGLSQLHQLRGRVGRSSKQSFCILLHGDIGRIAYRKLSVLRSSQDGFFIAEQDLLLRGGGDILGYKQSGAVEFRFADPFDVQTVLNARSDAWSMLKTAEGRATACRLMEIFGYSLPEVHY